MKILTYLFFDLTTWRSEWLKESGMTREMVLRYRILPLNRENQHLNVGLVDPTQHAALQTISFHTGLHIRPMLVDAKLLDHLFTIHFNQNDTALSHALSKLNSIKAEIIEAEPSEDADEPIIEFVDQLIQKAIHQQVSDIHIEPYEHECRIRFRRDGLLFTATSVPIHLAARITTRLKITAHLNIAERRLPQDGRIQWRQNLKIDIRISTCPTLFGEKIVLRILDAKKNNLAIDALGMTEAQKKLFIEKLSQPQGLILVTGPTGSGKTMTLYSALHYLNKIEKNIASVEDPVEIELAGINQVNINPKIGLDFARVLRTLLRQDPDILMIGEIRDKETATIALQAAQTGHLVLSTLHTNNALETLNRLHAMGIENQYLTNSLSLIIAQRLVRRLCEHCRLSSDCTLCHQGYQGRVGIFELITNIDNALVATPPLLWEAGLEKVHAGFTTMAELTRVVHHA